MANLQPPKPAAERRRRNKPVRGEWIATPGTGWQHGPLPTPPDGLLASSRATWTTWFQAWWAAHWTPSNLPDVVTTILLFDQVQRGEFQRAAELRMWEDNLGITPKGQQDRRWAQPKAEEQPSTTVTGSHYGHLRVAK